jgi:CrcB protein
MKSYLLIALFGAFGTLARFSVIQITPKIFQTIFPVGTLTVNLLGCFLIGLVSGILDTKFLTIDENFKNYITIGFLGGFTTFSSFSQDFFNLINSSNYLFAFSYIFISVFFGLMMFYLGDKFIHIISKLQDETSADKLITVLSKRYENRKGGYSRIIRTRNRFGDNSTMAYIELVDKDFNAKGQDSGPVQKKTEKPKEEAQQLSK